VILGYTGTRLGMSASQMERTFRILLATMPRYVTHGGCVGGDDQFDEMAAALGIPRVVRPAATGSRAIPGSVLRARGWVVILQPREPLLRNREIVAASKLMIGAPATAVEERRSGTWYTIRWTRKRGKRLELLLPEFRPHEVEGLRRRRAKYLAGLQNYFPQPQLSSVQAQGDVLDSSHRPR
jgi:hypothetical protein